MRLVDRAFGWLMVLGGLLHAMGSVMGYRHLPELLLWSLCASLAELLLAAINLLRVGRPHDRPLAWISFAGCAAWLVAIVVFGRLIHNIIDPRVLIQAVITIVLAMFSERSAMEARVPARSKEPVSTR